MTRPNFGERTRGRGPKKTPGPRALQRLHDAVVKAARVGEPFPFIFGPPLGPLPKAVQGSLRDALVASGSLHLVVDVLMRGARDPNPRIRHECAHAMDWLADERCLEPLLELANDPVPRVRWMAMHALVCDGCKVTPLPACPDVYPLVLSKATTDPSIRVRRKAQEALRLMGRDPGGAIGGGACHDEVAR